MEQSEAAGTLTSPDQVQIGGGQAPGEQGGFDVGLFAVLVAVLAFVALTNLWLRWRAQGEPFGAALSRRLRALLGRGGPRGGV